MSIALIQETFGRPPDVAVVLMLENVIIKQPAKTSSLPQVSKNADTYPGRRISRIYPIAHITFCDLTHTYGHRLQTRTDCLPGPSSSANKSFKITILRITPRSVGTYIFNRQNPTNRSTMNSASIRDPRTTWSRTDRFWFVDSWLQYMQNRHFHIFSCRAKVKFYSDQN